MGLVVGLNLFKYSNANPLNEIDPLGLWSAYGTGAVGGRFHYGIGGGSVYAGFFVGTDSACFFTTICGTFGIGVIASVGSERGFGFSTTTSPEQIEGWSCGVVGELAIFSQTKGAGVTVNLRGAAGVKGYRGYGMGGIAAFQCCYTILGACTRYCE